MRRINTKELAEGIEQKKISLNLDKNTLTMVDELSKILKADRTIIITNLIGHGIHPMIEYLEKVWSNMKKEGSRDQIKTADKLLSEITSFSKKWKTNNYLD